MIIETDDHYAAALKELDALSDAQIGTPDGYRFEALSEALDAYDTRRSALASMALPLDLTPGDTLAAAA